MNEDAPVSNTNGSPEHDAPTPPVPTPADLASAMAPGRANPAPRPDDADQTGTAAEKQATDSPADSETATESTDLESATVEAETSGPGTTDSGTTESRTTESGTSEPDTDATATTEPHPTGSASSDSGTSDSGTGTEDDTAVSSEWGRVDASGEVFVRTPDGERSIGSWKVSEPAEALAFFQRKYDDIVVQVDLLEQRLQSGAATPDDTATGAAKVREMIADAHAIGDLGALSTRLDTIDEHIAQRRAERKAERAKVIEQARERKDGIASEAEKIAEGSDWRAGADRFRALLDEWKALPRVDRATDDALWRRFSTARTHYTRRRKAHFAQRAEQRDQAQVIKERLIKEAESLSNSTDWGPTSRRYRELMADWKAAGPAPRSVEESFWKRFRAAQDVFFAARSENQSQRADEQRAKHQAKEELLTEAEALLPATDWKAARQSVRAIQERWEQVGYVPRDSMRSIEGRLRRVEEAIRGAEQHDWQRSNPEARARAQATIDQLRTLIADLESKVEKARASGDERKLREAQEALDARRDWLTQAENALDEFAG